MVSATHPIAYWDLFAHPKSAPPMRKAWRAGQLVDRSAKAPTPAGKVVHERYIARPFADDPTLLGILFVTFVVVQFCAAGR